MDKHRSRREFLELTGLGVGFTFISALGLSASGRAADTKLAHLARGGDFYFAQLSDTHWGFKGAANPEAQNTLPRAIDAVNALAEPPDFVVFTGDLTHTTEDAQERRRRMAQFRNIVDKLKVDFVRFLPGEHDAALDGGAAYREFFGDMHYTFDHKGIHFVVLDNVSDPAGAVGDAQRAWLQADLQHLDRDQPIVVLTHRPLFDLYPDWDWATKDSTQVMEILMPYRNVVVFYGHIHQENHHMTGHIAHHAANSLIFPLPAPGSQPKRTPLPWDASAPYRGLGFREVEAHGQLVAYELEEKKIT